MVGRCLRLWLDRKKVFRACRGLKGRCIPLEHGGFVAWRPGTPMDTGLDKWVNPDGALQSRWFRAAQARSLGEVPGRRRERKPMAPMPASSMAQPCGSGTALMAEKAVTSKRALSRRSWSSSTSRLKV